MDVAFSWKTRRIEQPMEELFARQKFKGYGKKGVSGFWKLGRETISLVASSAAVGDVVSLSCFNHMNVSNRKIENLISGVVAV